VAGLEEHEFLAQGTIYPDVIESKGIGVSEAHRIKSHHNVGGLPEDLKFKLVEHCAAFSRMKFGKSERRLGCRPSWSGANPSPDPVWQSEYSGR